ncbi:hypothetical protein HC891_24365, partial [Candidatus Gracilibacteria bacterium]|nr:hypothetical protein [Candidatus Gracilibacteria bacterium]
MEGSNAALDRTREALSQAVQTLERAGVAAAREPLTAAQAHLADAVLYGRDLPQLVRQNDERIAALGPLGEELKAYIAQGRVAFDAVDEYAESTWSDIRGNGSEAQAAAERAYEHWQQAQQQNTMDEQEFPAAKGNLDAAENETAYARQLIDTIVQRLHDLETARSTARAEIEAAQSDIARGWAFVRANDADVGRVPEQKLQQAEQAFAAAQAEMQQGKPNWLTVVEQAQAANALADEALVGARSEAEIIEKLRKQVANVQQLATAEVKKIVSFVGLHEADIKPPSRQQIQLVQKQTQEAFGLIQQSEASEDERRRAALEKAFAAYQALQKLASQVYAQAYADFQELEQLRTTVNSELARTRSAIESAEQMLTMNRSMLPRSSRAEQRLRATRRSFDQITLPIVGEERLRATIKEAQAIRAEAEDAAADLRRSFPGSHGGMGGPVVIVGGGARRSQCAVGVVSGRDPSASGCPARRDGTRRLSAAPGGEIGPGGELMAGFGCDILFRMHGLPRASPRRVLVSSHCAAVCIQCP